MDRWFRNIAEYYKVQEVLEQCRVDWRTIQEDYDTSTASGRLKINIMLSVAQDEADRTSERIKAVFETKRQRLEPLTGNTPTGYKLDGKKLVKDPEAEAAVAAFFRKFLACGSISAAQREALEHGKRIEYQLASKMLKSPVYYGHYYGVDGMSPPYISQAEFEKIQGMRHKVTRKSAENRVYIFSGLVLCGDCGFRMGGRKQTRGKTPYYNCPGHYIKRSGCANKTNISEGILEQYLIDTIDERMKAYKIQVEKQKAERGRKDYRTAIASLKAKNKRLMDLYLNELVSLEECKKGCEENNRRIAELENEAKEVEIPDFSAQDKVLGWKWKDAYQELTQEEKREFWMILIDKICVFPDRHIEYTLRW